MDKTPQIAEEQLVMTIDKAKSEEIPRWRPIDKALDYDFSATKMFFENRRIGLEYHNMIFPNIALP